MSILGSNYNTCGVTAYNSEDSALKALHVLGIHMYAVREGIDSRLLRSLDALLRDTPQSRSG